MIEQETVLALIEVKDNLENILDYIRHGVLQDRPQLVHLRVTHALGLIESILARGR